MKIKKVEKGDLTIVSDILVNYIDDSDRSNNPATIDHVEKLLADDKTYLFAAIIDDSVAGYVLAYRFPALFAAENMAYLYDIEVNINHRRKGIGRLLVETLISTLKDDDVNELWVGTGVDNTEGQGLFGATGAIRTGEIFYDYTYYLTAS